jgi:hypothetical protein
VINAKSALPALLTLVLLGCNSNGEFDATGGVTITRSACPAVAIPAATGDVTLFNPANSRDASAIDVEATMTNVRSSCDDSGTNLVTNATFEVQALRRDAQGDRDVVLPYFATIVHSGTNVVSKRISRVSLHFANGQYRASTTGSASSQVLRSAATLPEEIRQKVTRNRKPGDADAAVDPMTDPAVKAAVSRASFELLLGFQLTADQLAYNATR